MKIIISIMFLLMVQIGFGQNTKKFDRNLKKAVKHQKEVVFIYNIPQNDFNSGKYKISKKNSNSEILMEYTATYEGKIVAKILVYNYEIIKIIPIKK